jgi:pectin methylesterase-like acyl-CoA thioesterase
MRKIVTLLLLLVLLTASIFATFAPVKAEPKTITVPDDYPTIQAAVGNASDGDTVYVKNGIYRGQDSNVWLTIDKSISLVGEDNQQAIICQPKPKAQRDCIIKVTVDSVTI